MDPSRIILGSVTTEKAERLKLARTYVLRVDQSASKIDVKNALSKYYGIEVTSIRSHRVRPKSRNMGLGRDMEKRHRSKRMIVTLDAKSPPLDLMKFSS
jgi:ribosomal protein L23